jgi:alkanesulfonate monooxygenase SsuD/methylene tetrahydromethanopterin reductase-like flavin-dependent oxidoreductase (luciferase family)
LWLVGAPETVAARINDLYEQTGGFGYLVITSYDARDEREPWIRNLRLLAGEVLPACPGSADRVAAVEGGDE